MPRNMSQELSFFASLSSALLQSGEPEAYVIAGAGRTFKYAAPTEVEKVFQDYQLPPDLTARDVFAIAFQSPDIRSNSGQLEYSDPFHVVVNGAAVRITVRSANGGVYRLLLEVVDAVQLDADVAARVKMLETAVSELTTKVGLISNQQAR